MEPPEIKTSDTPPSGGPLQYSLRTIFIVMTVLAVALSGIFNAPPWVSALTGLFLGLMAPMVLTVVVIYGRGYMRTFCIGALFPAGLILMGLGPGLMLERFNPFRFQRFNPFTMRSLDDPSDDETRLYIGIFVFVASVVIVASGLVAVGVRWMVEAPQRRQQREAFLREQTSHTSDPAAPTPPES